ncbi:ankyrin repeat domain-containing protein [bacterium]|nr:ankyrin repeat domain-containing protein [bacterium]MBU1995452.1 ankyrin repeat domain-containing protein [bacterium]
MNKWLEFLKNNDYLSIKKYMRDGADVNDTNEHGESILACGIRCGCDIDILFLLIENGADIHDFDEEGVSIFDMSITYNNIALFNYLLEHGIDINKTKRRSGFTPLMAAACYGRVEITKTLLAEGANIEARDVKGFTATDFARKMNKKSILNILNFDKNNPKNTRYAR